MFKTRSSNKILKTDKSWFHLETVSIEFERGYFELDTVVRVSKEQNFNSKLSDVSIVTASWLPLGVKQKQQCRTDELVIAPMTRGSRAELTEYGPHSSKH